VDGAIVGKSLAASAVMLVLLPHLGRAEWPPLLNVVVRGALGTAVAALCFVLLDVDLRRWAWIRMHTAAVGRRQ
jgi:hypothetical protein